MIDKECHACHMKVQHSRHDKGRRRKNRSHYTSPQIHVDWDEIKIINREGKNVKRISRTNA